MTKNRMEAFSDGVIAIVITIMVLEMKAPHGVNFGSLRAVLPGFLSYILSFLYLGIYWNNHHHLLHTACRVNGKIMWANLHLLFWLSLIPFVTSWLGDNPAHAYPTALYGSVLLLAGCAYMILQTLIVGSHGKDSPLAAALGRDFKGKVSIVSYVTAIALAFLNPWLSDALYLAIAVMWMVPDRRLEKALSDMRSHK